MQYGLRVASLRHYSWPGGNSTTTSIGPILYGIYTNIPHRSSNWSKYYQGTPYLGTEASGALGTVTSPSLLGKAGWRLLTLKGRRRNVLRTEVNVLRTELGEGAPFEPAPFRLEVFGKHKLKFSYWTYQKVNPQPQYYHPKRGRLVRQCADSRGHNVL
eukprot:scaffold76671_cov61-Phaeocystis_antarctica.AAC.1